MRRLIMLLIMVTLALGNGDKVQAQAGPKVGDFVFITAQKLPVYVQPAAQGVVVDEMIPGMVSHILKMEQATDGTQWIYLSDNAFGWVQSAIDGKPTVASYSVQTLQQFIDAQTKL